jgi:type I restriction enzyme, S subunit
MPRVNTSNFWKKVPIKNLYVGLYDGPHATPKPSSNGPVFLGIKNIMEDGKLDLSQIRNISEDDFPKWTKRILPTEGDIVFSYEATLNLYAMIPKGFRGCLGRRLALIRPDTEIVDPIFLYYSFFGEEWRNTISKNLISGATVDRIPLINFPNFEVSIPLLSIQRKIASVLSNYDDLIENNTRRIEILEQMAKLVYEEWFIKFRFPGHENVKMVSSELGEIPEGWEVKKLPDLCSKVIDGTHDSPKPSEKGYFLVTGKHIVNGFINFSDCYLISPEEHSKVIQRSKPEKGDIIFSNIGTLGSIALVDQDFEFSIKNVALFKPLENLYSNYLYLYFSLPETYNRMERKASGTSQKFFSLNFLRNLKIVEPPKDLLHKFDSAVKPLIEERSILNKKNQNLRKTRDLLLPKLISGEIDISDLDIRIKNEYQENKFNFGEPQDGKGFRVKMV